MHGTLVEHEASAAAVAAGCPLVAAIDGSCQPLVERKWFAAWRCRALLLVVDHDHLCAAIQREHLTWCGAEEAPQAVRRLAKDLLGTDQWPSATLARAPTASMTLLELALAQQAVATLLPGSLLLLDGALRPRQVTARETRLARLRQLCALLGGPRRQRDA
jgi:hypothetical protein